ncbi:sodium/panthothenate symporter [Candidatus Methanoplasma termitum]|uniref:Sodium/panthothenate symporter n=1 Tax=Candidatus Methanoplasma termitum TaxID=1577791 RepID=A0A0A7LBG1_9ARCH|nr:sodium:solute symporter family protein [Candidatus Methanoplasma termitum]AIZ56358.1 sodium/panthothenate symporter [Candidatus Methanoplasma termitum]MCL2333666.1 sodium:solute symporter family protein [Candidatus Methanoplasma sp.]
MANEAVSFPLFIAVMILFIIATIFLGWYGFHHTKSNKQFLLGRNKTNPLIIALSYGATFLSASAIVGFGGQAAVHGMTMIWLCFLNLFLGLFIAFVVFGRRVRRIGLKLGASTFSDLFGKIFKSKGIRMFAAVIIIVMMPIYCAAVLKAGVNSVVTFMGLQEFYNIILIILAVIVGAYVVYGGIIAVMYNDALQAGIMFVGMIVILVITLITVGGFTHAVDSLKDYGFVKGMLDGGVNLAAFPVFNSKEFWLVISTFILGVGIGALTQPQLVVRFMSAKDNKTLNKSLIIGSIFMIAIVASAYTVGAFTNVYFMEEHGMTAGQYMLSLPDYANAKSIPVDYIIPQYVLEVFKKYSLGDLFICVFILALLAAAISTLSALMHTIGTAGGHDVFAVWKDWKKKRIEDGKSTKFSDNIVATWEDFKVRVRKGGRKKESDDQQSLFVNRSVTAIVMVLIVVYCFLMPNDIVAKATSLFMGLTAAAILPLMIYGLFGKDPKKNVALASITVGTVSYLFWALFINSGSSIFLPICKWLTGNPVLFGGTIQYVDALIISLPLSAATLIIAYAIMWWKNKRTVDTGIEVVDEGNES